MILIFEAPPHHEEDAAMIVRNHNDRRLHQIDNREEIRADRRRIRQAELKRRGRNSSKKTLTMRNLSRKGERLLRREREEEETLLAAEEESEDETDSEDGFCCCWYADLKININELRFQL